MGGSKEQSRNVISELFKNLSLLAHNKSKLTVGLDFAEMSRMKREIDRLRNRNAFENKKSHKAGCRFCRKRS